MVTRRHLLSTSIAIAAAGLLPRGVLGVESLPAATRDALAASGLVYLTPIKSNGQESTCHAEIWFAFDGTDLLLCTAHDTWRAQALAQGLNKARLWVGEFGTWTKSEGKFRQAPELMVTGTVVSDPAGIEHGLEQLGAKYRVQWATWGPRFRDGLADGSRVMLRYTPSA